MYGGLIFGKLKFYGGLFYKIPVKCFQGQNAVFWNVGENLTQSPSKTDFGETNCFTDYNTTSSALFVCSHPKLHICQEEVIIR